MIKTLTYGNARSAGAPKHTSQVHGRTKTESTKLSPLAAAAPCSVNCKKTSGTTKQWKKEQVWPFFGCCTTDSQTDTGSL